MYKTSVCRGRGRERERERFKSVSLKGVSREGTSQDSCLGKRERPSGPILYTGQV